MGEDFFYKATIKNINFGESSIQPKNSPKYGLSHFWKNMKLKSRSNELNANLLFNNVEPNIHTSEGILH